MVGNLDLQRLCSSDNKLSGVFFMPGMCSDSHISHLTVARKYQIVQQCLYAAAAKPEEAEALWRDSEQSSRPGSGMYCPEKSRISA
jgi:hypothetical protein